MLAAVLLSTATLLLLPHPVDGLLLWLALVYVYGVGGLLVLRGLRARRRAAAHLRELEHERALPLAEVVEGAVREERRRLAMDIRRVLLDALTNIRDDTTRLLARDPPEGELPDAPNGERRDAPDADLTDAGRADLSDADLPATPLTAAVGTLRSRAQLATSELRRLLGILRVAEDEKGPDPAAAVTPAVTTGADLTGAAPTPAAPRGAVPTGAALTGARTAGPTDGGSSAAERDVGPLVEGRPPRRDVVQTVVIVALAVLECFLNLPGRGSGALVLPLLMTVLAAALFVGHTVAPILTALAQGLVFATAGILGAPVMSGVWMVRGVGGVLWRSAASTPQRQGIVAALALGVTVLASRQDEPPLGVLASWVVVLVSLGGGFAAAWSGHLSARADREAETVREAADAEVRLAVATERLRLARELHDTVSHSVGVIAMQLNVLDVADTPQGRRAALESIQETSAAALRDLTDLDAFPGGIDPTPPSRTLDDVAALVQRVRTAGTRVDLSVVGVPERGHMSVLYRLLQEALTNALLHAPGASVQVMLQAGQDGTHLVVQDDGPGSESGPAPAHYGITGLRERVHLAGGTLHLAARGADGGFRLSAHLPPGPTLGPRR